MHIGEVTPKSILTCPKTAPPTSKPPTYTNNFQNPFKLPSPTGRPPPQCPLVSDSLFRLLIFVVIFVVLTFFGFFDLCSCQVRFVLVLRFLYMFRVILGYFVSFSLAYLRVRVTFYYPPPFWSPVMAASIVAA